MTYSTNYSDFSRVLDTKQPLDWRQYFTGAYYYFASLASTQQYLREHPPLLQPIFCQTLKQTNGQGQRGRIWRQTGEALLFSCALTLPGTLALQQGLTQAIALALVNALDADKQCLQLKWPNDIYFQQRKLGGILVEGSTHPLDKLQCQIIIGIGINISRHEVLNETGDEFAYWQEINASDNSEDVLAKIMPKLIACLDNWAQQPYLDIHHRWSDYDLYHHKIVSLENQEQAMLVMGIDQKGRLLCRDKHKTLHYLTNTRIISETNECTY